MDDPQTPPPRKYMSQPQQSSGTAIASMVLGICSIVTCMAYGVVGLACGILAVYFAKKGENAIAAGTAPESSRGMLNAGRICGWVGICLSSLMFVLIILYFLVFIGIFAAAASGAANSPTLLPF